MYTITISKPQKKAWDYVQAETTVGWDYCGMVLQ